MRASANMILLHISLGATLACGAVAAGERLPSAGVEIGEQMRALIEADWIDRDRRFAATRTADGASARRNARGVTTAQDAAGGCDGIKNGRWGFHTASKEREPWWQVDLGQDLRLDRVVVFNRTDGGTAQRTRHLRLLVARGAKPQEFRQVYQHNGETFYGANEGKPLVINLRGQDVYARIVRLHVPGQCSFALDEVEVYAVDDPQRNVALGRPADQKSVGPHSYVGTMGHSTLASLASRGGGFSLAHTRDVVERGKGLVARLRPKAAPERLDPLAAELASLDRRLARLESAEEVPEDTRKDVYLEARWLVRKIAFCNPLLAIDRLLFVKRHDPGGVFHMCDQYYGFNAKPGGGLFVLSHPFTPHPKLANLLGDSVVEKGRLAGSKLLSGSFLSPDVSWDGETVLFAYTQCQGGDLTWTPEASFHIFKVNADGTGLEQLTDGPWNDFDPCFLPNGRVAFISERRGGYLRCGRHCPTYTMHSMKPDGSDIIRLSYHETHEWHPSVGNDGMIVYSRWDYVDRDTNIAHHIWTCFPDGRSPRSFHGNYPVRRESRPWMEMSIRAIPDSPKYVATAAAHHGNAFGSLVLIDPRLADDGAMAQLERLTPDALFPEAEGRTPSIRDHMVYGTPWPLSEDDYLCVYDADARNRGLYWVDRFGNKELIYRDPSISSLSPIPLRPRLRPPVIPDQTTQTAAGKQAAGGDRPATIAVMNVYDSDFQWPQGTVIEALRIIQVLPKTTPPPNRPRIGVADQTNARAVLGSVPVEADGSAYFLAPVGKAIYFQALDKRGMAVQSMRSDTYVHPGEQLTCLGCHEPKLRAPQSGTRTPLALRRAPSPIRPDVDGSNPFNYPRLVQPVLDRNCVDCHQQEDALDLSGAIDGPNGFTRSYNNLAGKYGFYFHVRNGSISTGVHGGSRTVPGKFGARAAPLLQYMDERHYGLKLSEEDFHRLALWLDCNSEFYGAYENTEAQARGEVVWPSLH